MKTRFLCMIVACVLAVASAPASTWKVVARVKVHNPGEEMADVVVRGTLPMPKDFPMPPGGFGLADGEAIAVAQMSVLATYAGRDATHPVGRPEVVQLAARVSLPPNGFKEFDVVGLRQQPRFAVAGTIPGKAVAAWLAGEAPVLVEATDCFGNRYRAAPLAEAKLIEVRQSGPVLTEKIYQAILTPVAPAKPDRPALKKFFRVRAYLTLYGGEEFASLALMIHNGSIEAPNGTVYYRDIRVGVAKPMGLSVWRKQTSPAAGDAPTSDEKYTWQPCPAAAKDAKVFVMRDRAAAVLRTFVFAGGAKDRALAYAANPPIFVPAPSLELFSWSNFATARYGAGSYPVPMSLSAETVARSIRRVGRVPHGGKRFGHAMPAGVPYGGMTGGEGVYYVFGLVAIASADNRVIHNHTVLADRHWDRHRAHHFYDKDGKGFIYGRHLVDKGGKKHFDVHLDKRGWPAPLVKDPACAVQAAYVKDNDLLSPAAKQLLRYMNHDDQHLSRVFDIVPSAYLACDPINRDRAVALAGLVCAKLNIHPYAAKPRFGGFGSLHDALKRVTARPGKGVRFGRANGWLNHAMALGFYLSRDRQVRADCLATARVDVKIRQKAQMPAGNVTVHRPYSKAFGGQYWYVNAWQSVGIMGDGARCLLGILSSPADREHAEALKRVYARVGRWSATVGWNKQHRVPAGNVGLRKKGESKDLETPYMQFKKSAGTTHYFASPYAWFYELTGDKLFLERIKEMARGNVAGAASRTPHNWSYCLWLAQGGKIPGKGGL